MTNLKTIVEMQEEHKDWLKKLAFYHEELLIMAGLISEADKKISSNESLALKDDLLNQLVLKQEEIDFLLHDMLSHTFFLQGANAQTFTLLDQEKFSEHEVYKANMIGFEKLFIALRFDLVEFLSKWM